MHEHTWAILLASGREHRLPAMMSRTRPLAAERLVAVVRRGLCPRFVGAAPAQVIEEPDNHGPLVPVLVAALHVRESDPHAVLVATDTGLPDPDRRGFASFEQACRRAGRPDAGVVVSKGNPASLLIARPESILRLTLAALPEAMPWFEIYRQVLRAHRAGRAGHEDLAVARSHLYSRLPRAGYDLIGAALPWAAPQRVPARHRRSLRLSASSGLSSLH
jgi:hypothetical protein